jgi:hypothetical protein
MGQLHFGEDLLSCIDSNQHLSYERRAQLAMNGVHDLQRTVGILVLDTIEDEVHIG